MRASLSSILINNGANIVFFYKSKKLISIKKKYIFILSIKKQLDLNKPQLP